MRIILIVLLIALACPAPGLAMAYTYDITEQPDLTADVLGVTEYFPGDDFALTVDLTNTARAESMQLAPFKKANLYNPTTALGVSVAPEAGDAPITIRSLPVVAGDIGSSDVVPVTIRGTVSQDAPPGSSTIFLNITYQYVSAIPGTDANLQTITPIYNEVLEILPVTFRVKGQVRPVVCETESINMVPGSQGYLNLTLKNAGYATGHDVALIIVPADNTTFQLVDASMFVGTFRPGDVITLHPRIAVTEDLPAGSYSGNITGIYKDAKGIYQKIPTVPVRISVARGAVFTIARSNLTLAANDKRTITLTYTNRGDSIAYNAEARITGDQVIVPETDTTALGDVLPGESVTAEYVISSEKAIPGKQYVLDSEVKYRDSLGTLMLSDQQHTGVSIEKSAGLAGALSDPVILLILAAIIAYASFLGWKHLTKKQ